MKKIYVESLGCPKNLVDSETILKQFSKNYIPAPDPESADIICINTCGFIQDAKEESIECILNYSAQKNKKVIVTGCLVNLYKKDLQRNIPEIKEYHTTNEFFKKYLHTDYDRTDYSRFSSLTPDSYSYIKIADGCSRGCSYCIIPLIKGRFYSRSVKEIIKEIKVKISKGVQEIILIAQDLINFGKDNNENLFSLLDEIEKIDQHFYVRLLYIFPDKKVIELVQRIADSNKILKYIDIPVQHISRKILKMMNRPDNPNSYYDLFEKIKKIDSDLVIRSTFILGFPGEEKKHFKELLHFIKTIKFNWAGFYAYSDEEKSRSYFLPDKIDPAVIHKRKEEISNIQKEITGEWLQKRIGKIENVFVDEYDPSDHILYTRSYAEAPEIDGNIIIPVKKKIKSGKLIKIKITNTLDYDLEGEIYA